MRATFVAEGCAVPHKNRGNYNLPQRSLNYRYSSRIDRVRSTTRNVAPTNVRADLPLKPILKTQIRTNTPDYAAHNMSRTLFLLSV
jgi:hypothetical protein